LHTLLSVDPKNGERRYADVLQRIEKLQKPGGIKEPHGDDKDNKIAELREDIRSLSEDKVMMAREIDRLGMELLESKEEVARLSSLEVQNAELREEIRRMQDHSSLRLVGGGKGGKNDH
jgi:chromosome segregation ATPase